MVCELTVYVKNEEKKLTKDHLIYETFSVADDDPVIVECKNKAIAEFQDIPDKVRIKITMEL